MTVYGAIARFIGMFIVLTVVVGGFFYFSKLPYVDGLGFVVIFLSVVFPCRMFIKQNRRYFTQQERTVFFLVAWLLPIIVEGVRIALLINADERGDWSMPMILAITALILLTSAFVTWCSMGIAKSTSIKQGILTE